MSDTDAQLAVLAQLERLRQADKPYGRPKNWLKARRLVIVAACCQRSSLIEVMDTDPPCVLVGQVMVGSVKADAERKPWAGVRRGDQGFVWLSTFERMAEERSKQMVPCRHRRWWIPANDVVTLRGRHTLPLSDKPGRTR